jgi:predicted nucleic acid-binding protein
MRMEKNYGRVPKALIDKIASGELEGYFSIISLMEIAVVLRKCGADVGKSERKIEQELGKRLDELKKMPNLNLLLPTSIDFGIAWSYLYERKLTPFDSIILSSASAMEIPIITRDSKFKTKSNDIVDFYQPEEFIDKFS